MSVYDALHKHEAAASQTVRYVYFKSLPRAEQDLQPLRQKVLALGEPGRGFYDAMRGIYTSAKERDLSSLFMKLYRQSSPAEISALSETFRKEAYRTTTDDYERGFLIAWEIASKTLSELKSSYPDYPLKDEQPAENKTPEAEDTVSFDVAPRKKPRQSPDKAY
jgi:hypothetical protein